MESLFRPPEPLVVDGNVADNWKRFSQKFDVFLTASGLSGKPAEIQVAVFLNLIGDDGLELYNSFTLSDEEKKSLESIKTKFKDYCSPQENVIFERFKFNSICQKEGQTFDSFLTELRKAVKTTGYQDQDDMIRDQIVIGILEKNTQERLLRESKLTLTRAVEFCRAVEISKNQSKILQSEVQVNALKSRKNSFQTNHQDKMGPSSRQSVCKFCGYKHVINGRCPANGKTCAACQGRNHFAAMCPQNRKPVAQKKHEKKQ